MPKIVKKNSVKLPVKEVKNNHYVRPSWDEYFMSIAELVGTRATCDRGRSGCVIVKNKRVLVTGYVGSPIGMEHCDDGGHEMHKVINEGGNISDHCIRTIHAEQNAIAQAARVGIPIDGSTLYCHMTPCYTCAKILANSGVIRVVANLDYQQSSKTKELFKKAGIVLDLFKNEIDNYKN